VYKINQIKTVLIIILIVFLVAFSNCTVKQKIEKYTWSIDSLSEWRENTYKNLRIKRGINPFKLEKVVYPLYGSIDGYAPNDWESSMVGYNSLQVHRAAK